MALTHNDRKEIGCFVDSNNYCAKIMNAAEATFELNPSDIENAKLAKQISKLHKAMKMAEDAAKEIQNIYYSY